MPACLCGVAQLLPSQLTASSRSSSKDRALAPARLPAGWIVAPGTETPESFVLACASATLGLTLVGQKQARKASQEDRTSWTGRELQPSRRRRRRRRPPACAASLARGTSIVGRASRCRDWCDVRSPWALVQIVLSASSSSSGLPERTLLRRMHCGAAAPCNVGALPKRFGLLDFRL